MRRPHIVALFLIAACSACNHDNTLRTRGGGRPDTGLPSEDVIEKIPLGDVAGIASSDLATTVSNPFDGNPQAVQAGHDLFLQMNCASCHGYDAKGGMGPNLADSTWRFGASPVEVYKSIFEGRREGMPAWGRALPPTEIWKLVAYIQSLGGMIPASSQQRGEQSDLPNDNVAADTARTGPAGQTAAPDSTRRRP